jgi:hypothetical protein
MLCEPFNKIFGRTQPFNLLEKEIVPGMRLSVKPRNKS